MAASRKKRPPVIIPDKMPLNAIDPRWNAIEKSWVELENAAIIAVEDLGISSFGGEKISNLRAAVMKLRRERVLDDARELYRIIKEKDQSPEAKALLKTLVALVKTLPEETLKATC
jgi:hypothetical protein